MRVLYVIECDVPSPAEVPDPITAMRPPGIPYFAGSVRVVIDPQATELVAWLDADE